MNGYILNEKEWQLRYLSKRKGVLYTVGHLRCPNTTEGATQYILSNRMWTYIEGINQCYGCGMHFPKKLRTLRRLLIIRNKERE